MRRLERRVNHLLTALLRLGLGLGVSFKDRLKDNPRIRKAYYDIWNRRAFSDFFQHDRMLADRVRVDAYHRAITTHVNEGDVVIDLGTGTGILSFFAAAQNPKIVYALEHSRIVEAAGLLAESNGIRNVRFENVNSKDFTPDEQADLIIHEQIGEALFDEMMVDNLLDLKLRCLKPGGRILPGRFDLYIEPIRLREECYIPFVWEQEIHGISFARMKDLSGTLQWSYYFQRGLKPDEIEALLCEPEPIYTIDLNEVEDATLPASLEYRRPVVNSGELHGFCVYFQAHFDEQLSFANAPSGRRTSWSLSLLRIKKEEYKCGDRLKFRLDAGDLADAATWRWSSGKE
jgi:protein arginine N-methyltransferase 1